VIAEGIKRTRGGWRRWCGTMENRAYGMICILSFEGKWISKFATVNSKIVYEKLFQFRNDLSV
jgi:hypothetical protein